MLFVNLSQAPFIISCTIILLLLITGAIFRQQYLQSKFLSLSQQKQLLTHRIKGIKLTKNICLMIISIMLGISLLDPRGSSLSSDLELEGIDMVLVYDISRSMDVTDIPPNNSESRLDFAKKLGAQLIDSLVGNRIGLVSYAADAVRLLPLTTDIDSIGLFIDELSTDMLSSQSTDIGKALDEAVKNFREDTLTHKSIVLFTDGENLDGSVDQALDIIQKQGISLFIVGVGSEEGGNIPIIDPRTKQVTYFRNLVGQKIVSKLDSTYLEELASKSHGTYKLGSRASINQLSEIINNITKSPFGTNTQSYLAPKFRIFIIIALLALLLYLFLPENRRQKKLKIIGILFLLSINIPSYGLTEERKGYSAYKNGEYSTALRYYQRSLVKNPKNIKAKYGESASLYKLERGDRAEKAFLALTNSDNPKIAQQAVFNAANARIQKKDLEGALELYKQVLKDNPVDSRLYSKALNNYIYTKALQQQQNKSQQQKQDQESQKDQQENGSNQESQENQQEQEQGANQESQQGQGQNSDQESQEDQQATQSPSQSISPSDIDNLLGVAEKDEKANISKQFQDKKGKFHQNKY